MRFFATCLTGLEPVLRDEIRGVLGAGTPQRPGHDGRADVVAFEAPAVAGSLHLRCAEDLFVEVGAAPLLREPTEVAEALLDAEHLDRALSVYSTLAEPLRTRMSYRVVVRVTTEHDFERRDLRRALRGRVGQLRPRWRPEDPARLELWALQVSADLLRLGLRLTGSERSRRTTRHLERAGALRPSVAAAMVRLAGPPLGSLLDPCCGTGTIALEASEAGWLPLVADVDHAATEIAARNTDLAPWVADARTMPLPDSSVDALCANLPFGERFRVEGDPARWTARVLAEMSRVGRTGAPVILLAPRASGVRQAVAGPTAVALERTLDISLLGKATTVWVLRRT